MAELQAGDSPVAVNGLELSSETVSATVQPEGLLRGPRQGALLSALEDAGLQPDLAVTLDPAAVAAQPPRRGAPEEKAAAALGEGVGAVVVDVPPPPPGRGQVLLVEHNGAVSWTFPSAPGDAAPATRGAAPAPAGRNRYVVPVAPPSDEEAEGQRGILGAVIRRVLRVLTFDLIDKVAGEVGDHFVTRWEEKNRPHRLRTFGPDDYGIQAVPALGDDALRRLTAGPALLLIHGTNSLIHSGFGAFPVHAVMAMHDRYGGRVFGFDHPTLSVDPLANCRALAALLPDGVSLDVDILAHSRGGLVARTLAELGADSGTQGKIRVRQVVFVATPNRGTPLADPEHLGKLVDGLTNLLDLVPDNPVTDSLAGIVTVVKQLAVGALKGLDGLVSMRLIPAKNGPTPAPAGPDAGFLGLLNQARGVPTRYRAIAADFEPPPNSGLARVARDTLIDGIFGWEPNDLIVPTASAYSWNGADGFPLSERLVMPASRGVDHSTFWTTPEVLETLALWLRADETALRGQPASTPSHPSSTVDPLDEVEERFAAGDMDGVRRTIQALPRKELDELERQVGDVALTSFMARGARGPKAGSVFLLPGILGSHLYATDGADRDHIWLNPLRLLGGEFSRLRVQADRGPGRITARGLYLAYLPLAIALDEQWDVVPVPFDWRLPLTSGADMLAQAIADHHSGERRPAHIVSHSMGGLVARMLIAKHREIWDSLDSPDDRSQGGRLVMLGVPNLGAFSIALGFTGDDRFIRALDFLDFVNGIDRLRSVLASFPGAYELLPAPDAKLDAESQHEKLYDAASWDEGLIDADLLAAARTTHSTLAAGGLDPDRMYYFAGTGRETPDGVIIESRGKFLYRTTRAGDGRVPHVLGIPRDSSGKPIFGDRVWYSNAEHGDLPKDRRVIAAVADVLRDGKTERLRDVRPPAEGTRSKRNGAWVPAHQLEPAEPLDVGIVSRGTLRSASRSARRTAFQRAAGTAVSGWLGKPPAADAAPPVLHLHVLHGSLEHSAYPVLVGHYRGDPIRGAEGYLDMRLKWQLSRRQEVHRYPRELGEVLRISTNGGSPLGGIVVGLGGSGELTPTALASAVRDAALEHALEWLEQPEDRMLFSEGTIGLTSVMLGSYGSTGMPLPASVAAIVEGVMLANGLLAERGVADKVRIGELELVERYAAPAEEAARVLRTVESRLPTAVRALATLVPDQFVRPGEGRRPAVPTSDYGAGMWHRLIVSTTNLDPEGHMVRLHFTSLGSRARADQLVQDVDVRIVGRMLQDAVVRTSVDGSVNVALFEMLFPNDIKRELAAVENVQLVLDARAADFPWEALTDRGALTGARPLVHNAGLLRQLSLKPSGRADPSSGTGAALVIGDPPGPRAFGRLDGARREAKDVAALLTARLTVTPRIFEASSNPPDSATQVLSALMADDYQVVHIAGHGYFEPPKARRKAEPGEPAHPGTPEVMDEDPTDERATPPVGGVVIGPGEAEYLTASMFRNMRRPPDLVFLNCCHLASVGSEVLDDPTAPPPMAFARKRTNEMAASLSRELMDMGVKAVIAAGWSVSDKPAAAFASRFYEMMLSGSILGEAVRSARDAAFAADGGASNTWAAYQCYGDPAFRMFGGDQRGGPYADPVSADELVRRLEDISVQGGDAGGDKRAELVAQVEALEDMAEKQWSEGRVWSALGDAYRSLGSYEAGIRSYRKALEVKESEVTIGAVEQLAYIEYLLAMEVREGADPSTTLGENVTAEVLRDSAESRLNKLDALGPSAERHSLRGGLYKRDAVVLKGAARRKKVQESAEAYVKAWKMNHLPYPGFNALQLAMLGAELPAETKGELVEFLRKQEGPLVETSFWDRAGVGDRMLTTALVDKKLDEVETIAAAYIRAFDERSLPLNRNTVIGHVEQLGHLATGKQKAALERLSRRLSEWTPGPGQS